MMMDDRANIKPKPRPLFWQHLPLVISLMILLFSIIMCLIAWFFRHKSYWLVDQLYRIAWSFDVLGGLLLIGVFGACLSVISLVIQPPLKIIQMGLILFGAATILLIAVFPYSTERYETIEVLPVGEHVYDLVRIYTDSDGLYESLYRCDSLNMQCDIVYVSQRRNYVDGSPQAVVGLSVDPISKAVKVLVDSQVVYTHQSS